MANNKKRILILVFLIYCLFILWMTIFKRTPRVERKVILDLFWSFKELLAGGKRGRKEVLQYFNNILFFIPFGALFPWKKNWKLLLISAITFSLMIELIQYIFMLGWCEIDDVISNALGAMIGLGFVMLIDKTFVQREKRNFDEYKGIVEKKRSCGSKEM